VKTLLSDLIASTLITSGVFILITVSPALAGTLSCSLTTAALCTGGTNVIVLRMSAATNAHSELPSQATASYATNVICCSGVTGLGNSCSGTFATVVNLKAVTDSHVQESTQSGYTNSACISVSAGTVSVGYQASNCTGFDTTVASLPAVTNSHIGGPNDYTNKICATAAATSLTFSTDSSTENFLPLSPGSLVATSSILTVTTNNATGFAITIQRVTAAGTMSLGSNPAVTIPDKSPDWIAPAATSTAGNATASTTQPLTLQFRVAKSGTDVGDYASSWWGTDDATANALFAGIPSTTQTIIKTSTAAVSTTTSSVFYDLNTPTTQQNGSYSGSVTYTATANP
jgi:hypothetical protein